MWYLFRAQLEEGAMLFACETKTPTISLEAPICTLYQSTSIHQQDVMATPEHYVSKHGMSSHT